jgi:hypothetical protein
MTAVEHVEIDALCLGVPIMLGPVEIGCCARAEAVLDLAL